MTSQEAVAQIGQGDLNAIFDYLLLKVIDSNEALNTADGNFVTALYNLQREIESQTFDLGAAEKRLHIIEGWTDKEAQVAAGKDVAELFADRANHMAVSELVMIWGLQSLRSPSPQGLSPDLQQVLYNTQEELDGITGPRGEQKAAIQQHYLLHDDGPGHKQSQLEITRNEVARLKSAVTDTKKRQMKLIVLIESFIESMQRLRDDIVRCKGVDMTNMQEKIDSYTNALKEWRALHQTS